MTAAAIIWAGVAAGLVAGLVVAVRTRWLQSRTLEKCVALSVAIHAVLALVCAFVGGWTPASWGRRDEERMTLVLAVADEASDTVPLADAPAGDPRDGKPVESDVAAQPASETAAAGGTDRPDVAHIADIAARPELDSRDEPPPPLMPLVAATTVAAGPPDDHVPLLEAPAAEAGASLADEPETPASADRSAPAPAPVAAASPATSSDARSHQVPATYADRVGGRRAAAAAERGGSEATERAVQAALGWLAASQSDDGRWDAARHGSGIERSVDGHHRQGAGARADHGVTGLALLAFLGAGVTHRDGAHAAAVDRGLRFLVSRQRADGSLAGDAEFFAALYCHGMATIAVTECLAMTGDASLRPAVERAVAHTLAMQHPHTGGWRYAAGDRGDTSQCGWQVMVLATARTAGLGGFDAAEARARLYLRSVASGAAGGLGSYRPGERPSMAMTAEALYCRLVLGASPSDPAAAEALATIAAASLGRETANAYAWYYATLASFHAGGSQWERWNARLQQTLVPLQRSGGPLDGSWDPDPVWGGHGGRVYSTAMSALTLEVYYRHRPLHLGGPHLAVAPEGSPAR